MNRRVALVATLVVGVLLIGLRFGLPYLKSGGGGGGITPPVISDGFIAPTSDDLRLAVAPITAKLKGSQYAEHLAHFYRSVGRTIKSKAQSAQQAREINHMAGLALYEIAPYAAYQPDLAPLVEAVLDKFVGKTNTKYEEVDRAKTMVVFEAIAWATNEARGVGIFGEGSNSQASVLGSFDLFQTSALGSDPVVRGEPTIFEIVSDENNNQYCEETGLRGVTFDMANGLVEVPLQEKLEDEVRQNGANKSLPQQPIDLSLLANPPPADEDTSYLLTHGLIYDEAEAAQFAQESATFGDLDLPTGAGKVRLLYRALRLLDRTAFESEKQTTGDCTSHATRNACDTSRAYEILVQGDHEDFTTRGATEPIYGYRGHNGAGMSVYRAAKWVNEVGGFAVRQNYPGVVDLSTYNSSIGMRWGSSGPPRSLVSLIAPHKIQSSVLVKNVAEARDSLYNGYAIIVGSGYSFSPVRDGNGFAARTPQGWSHAMAWIATAPLKDLIPGNDSDAPCFLVANSWGKWNSGPKGKYSDIPDGSFWITPDVALGMIKQQQAIAVGNFIGFRPRPLKDWGFSYHNIQPTGVPSSLPPPAIIGAVTSGAALALVTGSARFDITNPNVPAPDGGKGVIVMPDGSVVVYDIHVLEDFGPSVDIPIDVVPVITPVPDPAPIVAPDGNVIVPAVEPDLSDPLQVANWERANPNQVVIAGVKVQRPAPYFAAQGTYILPTVWQETTPDGGWGLYKRTNGEWNRVSSDEFPEFDGKLPAPSRYPIGEKEELKLEDKSEEISDASDSVEPGCDGGWCSAKLGDFWRRLENTCCQLSC